ncbi:hypothetical protein [Nostoc sp.]
MKGDRRYTQSFIENLIGEVHRICDVIEGRTAVCWKSRQWLLAR